jgi:hypothetical protein
MVPFCAAAPIAAEAATVMAQISLVIFIMLEYAYKSFAHEVVVGDDAEIEQRRDGAGTAAREEHEAVGRQQAAVMA